MIGLHLGRVFGLHSGEVGSELEGAEAGETPDESDHATAGRSLAESLENGIQVAGNTGGASLKSELVKPKIVSSVASQVVLITTQVGVPHFDFIINYYNYKTIKQ